MHTTKATDMSGTSFFSNVQKKTNLQTTQNLLDSVSKKRNSSLSKRSNSRARIAELMQPILTQTKTRPLSIVPTRDSALTPSDSIFSDKIPSFFSPTNLNTSYKGAASSHKKDLSAPLSVINNKRLFVKNS